MSKDVKLSKDVKCQKSKTDVKMSKICQLSKIKYLYIDVNLMSHMKVIKIGQNTFYGHFEGFWWPSYVTSKSTSITVNLIMSISFFVNLLHSPAVWCFDIWHLCTIWHLIDILTSFLWDLHGSHGEHVWSCAYIQWIPTKPRWGTGRMEHMGNWGTWMIGHMGITFLILHGS